MFLAKGEAMGDARGAGPGRADLERMRVASHGDQDAQHSLTLYAVVDRVTPRLAWLSMRPVTGRTHQLRAHCEAIGHPIIGDRNTIAGRPTIRRAMIRCAPFLPGSNPSCTSWRAARPSPSARRTNRRDRPLPEHMKKGFAMFGFDARERDPIEDAPMSEARRDPMRAAQANMRPAAIKRFYRSVEIREAAGGQHTR